MKTPRALAGVPGMGVVRARRNPKTNKALLIGNQAKIVQPGSMALGAP
jgi:hypothetical protein